MKYKEINSIYQNYFIGKFYKNRLKKIINMVDVRDKRILDLGFGYGHLFPLICNYSNNIYGINIDEYQTKATYEILKKLKITNVKLFNENASKTHFEDNFFDVIFSNSVHEHIKDVLEVNKEIKRILNNNGSFILSVPSENFLYSLCRKVFSLKKPEDHFHNVHQIKQYIIKDFRIVKEENYPLGIPLFKIFVCKK